MDAVCFILLGSPGCIGGGHFSGMFMTRKERQRCRPAFHGLVTGRMLLYEELIRGKIHAHMYMHLYLLCILYYIYYIYSLRFLAFLYV